MVMHIYESFGLKHLKLVINSIGDSESRKEYNEALVNHLNLLLIRFVQTANLVCTNPMRILDCKIDRDKEAIKTAPRITDYLNDDSKAYYEQVKHHLDDLNIPYVEDPNQ